MQESNNHINHANDTLLSTTISWSKIGEAPNSWVNLLTRISLDHPSSLADAARRILKNDFNAEYHVVGVPWTAYLIFPDSDSRVRFLLTWG